MRVLEKGFFLPEEIPSDNQDTNPFHFHVDYTSNNFTPQSTIPATGEPNVLICLPPLSGENVSLNEEHILVPRLELPEPIILIYPHVPSNQPVSGMDQYTASTTLALPEVVFDQIPKCPDNFYHHHDKIENSVNENTNDASIDLLGLVDTNLVS